uniref:thioredoxin-dependent peroxiredoxin n=2 Tax=candidate division WOR-3 bacterium TaxID=2052148 RepID=A0A7V3ZXF9_UNCW3
MLKEGDFVQDFCLPDEEGKEVCLSSLKGKWIVLYFYPKDNTSGCTKEAIGFTEKIEDFKKLNAEVIGISKDSVKSHQSFKNKYGLKVKLLSDESAEILKRFGAWGKKKMYGKEVEGTIRSTFLIDPKGRIQKIWRNVKVDGHVDEVLMVLKEMVRGEYERKRSN